MNHGTPPYISSDGKGSIGGVLGGPCMFLPPPSSSHPPPFSHPPRITSFPISLLANEFSTDYLFIKYTAAVAADSTGFYLMNTIEEGQGNLRITDLNLMTQFGIGMGNWHDAQAIAVDDSSMHRICTTDAPPDGESPFSFSSVSITSAVFLYALAFTFSDIYYFLKDQVIYSGSAGTKGTDKDFGMAFMEDILIQTHTSIKVSISLSTS